MIKLTMNTTKVATRATALITIAMIASTFSLGQSAHAMSLFDKVKEIIGAGDGQDSQKQSFVTGSGSSDSRLKRIISSGDAEINRRLQALSRLNTDIVSATHLTASDKTALQNEVNSTISGLNALKTKLDADTSVGDAKADVQNILTEYRVYALVMPKVHLVKLADDVQATDDKLTNLASKLQTRLTNEKNAGKDVSALQSKLSDMNAQIAAAQNIAGNIEAKIISLQPSDYNSNHKVLSGYGAQLRTARSDNQATYTEAKVIINALKTL